MQEIEVFEKIKNNFIVGYRRGSHIYGTFEEGLSDEDYLIVVDGSWDGSLSQYPHGIFQWSTDDGDYEFISAQNFLRMIKNNDIVALEAIFLGEEDTFGDVKRGEFYHGQFVLDKWKLRQNVSAICSNSWVKAKKKMTVEKDYNLRIGQKSLFHSMRLYMFAAQIAKDGYISDYQCAKGLWEEIKSVENPTWEKYKEMYQEKFNRLRSELVKLCPRDESSEK